MGLFSKLKLETAGSKWTPEAPLPAYADYNAAANGQPVQTRRRPPKTDGEALVASYRQVMELKSALDESYRSVNDAKSRVKQLQELARQHGGVGNDLGDAYANGMPTPFTTPDFNVQTAERMMALQQIQAMQHAAQMTLGATMANYRAQEVSYTQVSAAFERDLKHLARDNAVLHKETYLLKAEAAQRARAIPAGPPMQAFPPTPPSTPPRHHAHEHERVQSQRPVMPPLERLPSSLDELLAFSPGAHAHESRRRAASFAAQSPSQPESYEY